MWGRGLVGKERGGRGNKGEAEQGGNDSLREEGK